MADVANAFTIPGKIAIVTGGGSGIGEATAKVFADAGATVVVADWNGENAAKVVAEIEADGGKASAQVVDVSDPGAVTELVRSTVEKYGALDIMVNNAGILIRTPVLDVTPEEFERILSVNLKGVLYGCQAAGRVMSPGSSIINVLSEIIDYGTADTASYAAAKRGAHALTRSFAIELGPQQIRVNGVAPGWTVSAITLRRGLDESGEFDQDRFDEVKNRLAAKSQLGVVNEPIDIAYGVLYLVSEAGRHITGQVLRLNSGTAMV